MEKNNDKTITLIKLLDIRFGDPISALYLQDTNVIFGTMMGKITLYSITKNKVYILSELSSENIVDISYSPKEKIINVAIGDKEIIKYAIDFSQGNIPIYSKIKNYASENEHIKYCENAFVMLSYNIFFRLQLSQPEEGNININNINSDFEIRNLSSNEILTGTLPMTNYSIPLDFYKEKFAWVEFLSDKERNLCIANFKDKIEKPYKFLIHKHFGHISHFKFLPGNKFILVRNLNICEIRNIDEKFTLIQSFKHLGDNVYAIDVFVLDKKRNINDNNLSYNSNKRNKDDILLNLNKNESFNSNEHNKSENINNKIDSNDNNDNNKDFIIVFLDIDGGVNIYQNGEISSFFNLNELKGIKKEEKNKTFFSMGYSYYIKYNLKYCIISSDHGCYVLEVN